LFAADPPKPTQTVKTTRANRASPNTTLLPRFIGRSKSNGGEASVQGQTELLEASGDANRPTDFGDLLRILDSELRLITPTDPEGKEDADPSMVRAGAKYFELTHDYLVHSIRDWLTRKQKETRRGRAELLLADRATVWNARPEHRQLPSLSQWLQIKWLTARKNWTPPERKMMRRADHFHILRGIVALLLFGFVSFGGWWTLGALAYSPEDAARSSAAMFLLSEMRLPEESEAEEFELPQLLTVAELAQVWHTVIDMQVKTHQGKKQQLTDSARQDTGSNHPAKGLRAERCGGAGEQRRGKRRRSGEESRTRKRSPAPPAARRCLTKLYKSFWPGLISGGGRGNCPVLTGCHDRRDAHRRIL